MTTKVKVKKTRAERKQHSRDMQAKHEAEKKAANLRNILKRDILATLVSLKITVGGQLFLHSSPSTY